MSIHSSDSKVREGSLTQPIAPSQSTWYSQKVQPPWLRPNDCVPIRVHSVPEGRRAAFSGSRLSAPLKSVTSVLPNAATRVTACLLEAPACRHRQQPAGPATSEEPNPASCLPAPCEPRTRIADRRVARCHSSWSGPIHVVSTRVAWPGFCLGRLTYHSRPPLSRV